MTTTTCDCGKPTAGATLCEDCKVTFAYAVSNIGVYWLDLETVATKRSRFGSGGGKGAIGKERPLPVDMRFINQTIADDQPPPPHRGAHLAPASQLKWDVWSTLVAWCRTVMVDQPPVTGPACATCIHSSCTAVRRRRHPGPNVPGMVNYLARQHRWIHSQVWAPKMLGELLDLERRLARLIDRPADRWYAGKCSHQDQHGICTAELYATMDRGVITCQACGTNHDVSTRRDFLLKEAGSYLVTATEAAGALLAWTDYDGSEAKLVDRIRKWRDREKLEVVEVTSLNGRDRHLYRLGDVQTLMIAAAQDRQNARLGDAS